MKRFNINEFLWFLILLGISGYIFFLIKTGGVNKFVHGHMTRYLALALVPLLLITVFQFYKSFTIISSRKIKKGYFIFFIMLIIMLSALIFTL